MIIKSLITQYNPFNSTKEIREWIAQRNREVVVDVKKVPFSELKIWHSEADGSIHHNSGKFFSIVGIDVQTDYETKNHCRQPIINQPEVGYLCILTKVIDGVLYCLMQAKISCINYANAKRNPLAQTRKWFMSYEEATHRGTESNPNVGGLLGVSDCSQVTDGAAVVVLCSEKYLQEKDLKDKAVVKGYGHRTAPMLFDKKMADNTNSDYVLPWTRQACLDAYRRANLTVDDIDVFETHDCFSSSEFAAISSFGICEP